MTASTAAAEPAPVAEPADVLEERPIPQAGWRVIAAKELGDHVISVRFMVLLILLGLAAATPLYFAADQIKTLAPQATGQAAVFLALFTIGDTNYSFLIVSSFVAIVAPLLGLAFSFDAINGERSEATLPRLLAQTIYRDDVINGKFVAGLTVIGLILAVVMLLVGAIGVIQLGIIPSAEDVARLIVWWFLSLFFIGFWLAFALLCSVLVRRAATSAMIALAAWLVLSLFFSLIVGVVAGVLSPVAADSTASSPDTIANQALLVNLSRLSPNDLYTEATGAVLNPTIRTTTPALVTANQADQAVTSLLPLDQSLLVIWPQFVAIIALTMVTFGAAYVAFMRQEIRA